MSCTFAYGAGVQARICIYIQRTTNADSRLSDWLITFNVRRRNCALAIEQHIYSSIQTQNAVAWSSTYAYPRCRWRGEASYLLRWVGGMRDELVDDLRAKWKWCGACLCVCGESIQRMAAIDDRHMEMCVNVWLVEWHVLGNIEMDMCRSVDRGLWGSADAIYAWLISGMHINISVLRVYIAWSVDGYIFEVVENGFNWFFGECLCIWCVLI